MQESAKYAPKEKIMIETDSPYLAPTPHRGKKNYPKYVVLVAQKLAELRGESLEQVADYTTANAVKLFSLK